MNSTGSYENTVPAEVTEGLPLRDRPLNEVELEVLRLILSSYRDGSGQNVVKTTGESMPGFRDFERAMATVVKGTTTENKGIFDVIVPAEPLPYGLSCKMAKMQAARTKSSFMEMANPAAKFNTHLASQYINWVTEPTLAGPAIIELVTSWHSAEASGIDLSGSRYVILSHKNFTLFQLSSFPLDLKIADPKEIEWVAGSRALRGYIDDDGRRHKLWECYLQSGGQLKYYPLLEWAVWVSEPFTLELPPPMALARRAREYFPDLWPTEWTN
ncbi:hypothetical protein [Mycolicibacterium elephantis]|uniref:hypothetical protein n=1 Tax=Mycolicibacterium elephantis TaxID=81858 RepID=UPI0010553EC9|nr:hypothetical protein [Mycolicibacterium elephantis]